MTNWPDLLTRHHAVAQADSGYEPIFGDPASPESIADLEIQDWAAIASRTQGSLSTRRWVRATDGTGKHDFTVVHCAHL